MRKTYLLVFNERLGTRNEIKATLNSTPGVIYWRTDLPHAFYILSDLSAADLCAGFRAIHPKEGRLLIAEIGPNKQGWLPPDTWYLINQKRPKRKEV